MVYWHDLTILWDDALRNEMASYILMLPLLIAYMIYQRRTILKAQYSLEVENRENILVKDIVGASLCLSALFLYVYGSFTFNVLEYHLISLIVFVFGCSVFLFGVQNLRNLVFPLGFLLLLIIPYREEAYQISSRLSVLTSHLTFNLLKLLRFPVSLSSTYESPSILVETASGQQVPFVIDIPCAGAYSLIGFFVFALFFAYIARGSQLKKLLWLLLGFVLIYGVNIVRVSLILMIGYWFGAETAMGLFHLLSGSVLIFIASFIMILLGDKVFKVKLLRGPKAATAEEECPACKGYQARRALACGFCGRFLSFSSFSLSKVDGGKILAVSLLLAILINVQMPNFTLAQKNLLDLDINELTTSEKTQEFLPAIQGYDPGFVYRDQRFEEIAQQDASILYVYRPQNTSHVAIFLSVEMADSYSKLHRWEICLYIVPAEGGQQMVSPIESRDIQIVENSPLIGRLFVFKYAKSDQTVMILYWYEKTAFKIEGEWEDRYVKTSLTAYLDSFVKTGEIKSLNEYAPLEAKMVSMAKSIIDHWEPAKTWSAFIIVFAQWGQTLAVASIIAPSALVTVLYLMKENDLKRQSSSVHKRLTWYAMSSKKEAETLKILEALAEKGEATGIELVDLYERKSGRKLSPAELDEAIRYAEKNGLAKKEIRIIDGRPVLYWKALNFND
jgi:exosortase